MRIPGIRERAVAISRYTDPLVPSGGLDTSIVAVTTDAVQSGRPVTGYGFSSMGRFAQGGLIRERFAPRLMSAAPEEMLDGNGRLDPMRAWTVMMAGEKPGGHGERCVAVGTLDMALWDIMAKIEDLPLHALLSRRAGRGTACAIDVYAAGGYRYPADDISRLKDELAGFRDRGYPRAKIKIGFPDLRRTSFWPHGGHLFSLHVAAGLGLGGAEVNPACFRPFGGHGTARNLRRARPPSRTCPGSASNSSPR